LDNRDRINDTIKKMDFIECAVNDCEKRMEELSISRDIFSRTETRLKELVDEAANLIKLFMTVKKTDAKLV
jgi:hypothetical protein